MVAKRSSLRASMARIIVCPYTMSSVAALSLVAAMAPSVVEIATCARDRCLVEGDDLSEIHPG